MSAADYMNKTAGVWKPWFAWYPVRVFYVGGNQVDGWAWLTCVEWREGDDVFDRLYRIRIGAP